MVFKPYGVHNISDGLRKLLNRKDYREIEVLQLVRADTPINRSRVPSISEETAKAHMKSILGS